MQKLLKKIKIRKASLKDTRFLYNIYNQNIIDNNFFSNQKLKYSDHKLWLHKNLSQSFIFICSKKYKIGYIRYDKFKKKDLKVSIAIKNSYKSKGIGKFIFFKTINRLKLDNLKIYAFIKSSNYVSKKFFLSCNFKFVKKNMYVFKYKNEKIYK